MSYEIIGVAVVVAVVGFFIWKSKSKKKSVSGSTGGSTGGGSTGGNKLK